MTVIAFINLKHGINNDLIIIKNSFVTHQLLFTNSNQTQNNTDLIINVDTNGKLFITNLFDKILIDISSCRRGV